MDNIIYYIHLNGQQQGPFEKYQLMNLGLTPETMVWRSDMPNWVQAGSLPELAEYINGGFNPYQQNQPKDPYYGNQPPHYGGGQPNYPYENQPSYPPEPYNNPAPYGQQPFGSNNRGNGQPQGWTNWLPWAIVGTIISVIGCCGILGLVFGIIGIVKANKANTLARLGNMPEANATNSTAKIMTIISLVIGGIGFLWILIEFIFLGASFYSLMEAPFDYMYY